jgi:hypothetical protein
MDILSQPELSVGILSETGEEKQTVLHVTCLDDGGFMLIRIWPSTFLVQDDGSRKKLLHAFNIASYPKYLPVRSGHTFTLVFEGLDKGCESFDLLEEIPEPDGFHIRDITRNKADVYFLKIGGH